MLPSCRASSYVLAVLILGLACTVDAQNAFTVTGPTFTNALTGGPPPIPYPNASFDVASSPSGSLFLVGTTGADAFVTIAPSANQCPGTNLVQSSTPITLFACVDTTHLVRGSYASLINISSFDGSIPPVRVPVQVQVLPVGEIKTIPASQINIASTTPHQAVTIQFVANNGASGGPGASACSDSPPAANGGGSGSACIASITADPASPPEGPWMTLSNTCSGVALVGNVTCSIQVTADQTKLTNAAVVGTTYEGHIIIETTHGDRADLVVNFFYSQSSGQPLTINSSTTFTGTGGQAFQATLTASGGSPPYTWSVTGLPASLTLNTATGTITGTPAVGVYPIMVSVKDKANVIAGPQQATINIQATPLITQMFPHITDGYDGSIWQSDFLLYNTSSTTVTAQLIFHLDNGVRSLSMIGSGPVKGINGIVIKPFGSAVFSTTGLATTPVVTGWVEVVSNLPVQGQVVFRRNTSPTAALGNYYEVSVPLVAPATSFTFPFDGTTYSAASARIYTALAIANASNSQVQVNCSAYDNSGNVLGPTEQIASLAAFGHTQEVLQFTSPIDTLIQQGRGLLTCSSTAAVGILGLRAFGDHALSALPIITGN
jgi:hypothetical protein